MAFPFFAPGPVLCPLWLGHYPFLSVRRLQDASSSLRAVEARARARVDVLSGTVAKDGGEATGLPLEPQKLPYHRILNVRFPPLAAPGVLNGFNFDFNYLALQSARGNTI